jgi:hypothetical protein
MKVSVIETACLRGVVKALLADQPKDKVIDGSHHVSGRAGSEPAAVFAEGDITANVNKVMVATLPYEVKRLTQEIGGGIVETGCMPSYKDFTNPDYGHLVQRAIKAGAPSAEARFKAARLSEWLTVGIYDCNGFDVTIDQLGPVGGLPQV